MSTIKVGPLPNGGECLYSEDIGLFNVRMIQEPDPAFGYVVIYSYDQTRLETYEFDLYERALADFGMIRAVLKNAQACIASKINLEVFGEKV